jgi:hypothetical protein
MKSLTTLVFSLLAASTAALTTSPVYHFPNGTWLENLAPTRNGSLLVTFIGKPEVYIVHPNTSTAPASTSLLHTFPNANSVLGITEVKKDVFAVAVGSVTPANAPVEGSFSIWTISLARHGAAEVEKISDLKNTSMVNGIAFHAPSHTLFLADSWAGNIASLNLHTKKISIGLAHPVLASNFSLPLPLGVNGLRVHNSYLYFSTTSLNLLGRTKITRDGALSSAVQVFAQGAKISQPDDFAVLADGSVLLARPLGDTVQAVGLDGNVRGEVKVDGATSVVVGKRGEVYVSTSGLSGGAPSGKGGEVVRLV